MVFKHGWFAPLLMVFLIFHYPTAFCLINSGLTAVYAWVSYNLADRPLSFP